MIKKATRYLRERFLKKDERTVLFLRLLLLVIALAILFLIFFPDRRNQPQSFSRNISINGNPATFDTMFGMPTTYMCNAVLRSKITRVDHDSVDIQFLSKMQSDRQFHPLTPAVTHTIRNGDCVDGYPLCADLFFEYCFTIKTKGNPVVVDYVVKEK